jgi:hypothetical protein
MIINKDNYSPSIIQQFKLLEGKVKRGYKDRLRHFLATLSLDMINGCILEFGVYKGETLKILSEFFVNEKVWGFDSFEGLPENWDISNSSNIMFPKGYFNVDKIPEFKTNVNLVRGYFENTLPLWIKHHQEPAKLIHIDCDLYSSTKDVLLNLNSIIVPGTIIIFDEFYPWNDYTSYDQWHLGEYKALNEWVLEYNRSFELIHRSGHQQCSIRILN